MRLCATIKLLPDSRQAVALHETLERCNAARDWLSNVAWCEHSFRQFDLHKLAYRDMRESFGVAAQVAVRCIAKVADAYKLDRKRQRAFRRLGAQPYDARIFRFCGPDAVSLWAVAGRTRIPFACGEHQRRLLAHAKGEVDLICVRDSFYLAVTCDVPEAEPIAATDVLGIDLGIVNIATDSDGRAYTGEAIERVRAHLGRRRAGLQRRGTKAAKRRLRILSGKQRRFQKHTNHYIAKAIVTGAQRSGRVIALEDLKGIRERVKARRPQRARLHNWAFGQLRAFVAYKAALAGVPVTCVDPAYTSRTCPCCGVIDKRNRPNQATFSCVSCGLAAPADRIAARNIRATAAVTPPVVLAVA